LTIEIETHTCAAAKTHRYETHLYLYPCLWKRKAAEREKVRNRCRRAPAEENEREKGAYGQIEARNPVKRNPENGIVNSNKYRNPGEGRGDRGLGIGSK